jgi:hypothetical protein
MCIWHSVIGIVVYVFTLTSAIPAFAQLNGAGQWVGDLYMVDQTHVFPYPKALVDDENRIVNAIPSISKATDFPVPSNNRLGISLRPLWHDGALYAVACGGAGAVETNEDGSKFMRHTFAKWSDGKWIFLGDYKTPEEIFLVVIPCDQERFIVISTSDLTGNNSNPLISSPFHRMSLLPGKKELRLDASIDHRTDELRNRQVDITIAYDSQIIMTDSYATIINYDTGLYWIFSLEKASLTHSGKIFKSITNDMIAKGNIHRPILYANPEKNGRILISASEEAAFLTETGDTVKERREMLEKNPDLSIKDMEIFMQRRLKELGERNPYIVWYSIDAVNGKVEKLSSPPIGATLTRDGTNQSWRPMSDGSVKMGPIEVKQEGGQATPQIAKTGEPAVKVSFE